MYNNVYFDKGFVVKCFFDMVIGFFEIYKDIVGMGINWRYLFVFLLEIKVVFVFIMMNIVYIFDKYLRRFWRLIFFIVILRFVEELR